MNDAVSGRLSRRVAAADRAEPALQGRIKRRRHTIVTCLALLLVVAPALHAQSGKQIVDAVDRLLRGKSSRGTVEMEIVTEHWSRTMRLRIWSLGTEDALVRVLSPAKDAGTATLKVGNDIWNYLPNVDRTIKLPASMMGTSWMGSHFTNDDLVKESHLVDDYDITIAYRGLRDGTPVWEFNLTPKPEAPVVWGRIVEQVRQRDTMPVWGKYYDDHGTLARTITFSDFKKMGGRLVPATLTVQPADKPDEHTTLRYLDLRFDVGLTPSFFSLRRLRAGER